MTPCERHADCINCNEHVCVKGDEGKTMRVRRRLEEANQLLSRAEEAKTQGYYGADRWMEHHQKTVQRLAQLTDIFDNPAVAVGAVIQLADVPIVPWSGVEQALEERDVSDGNSTMGRLAPAEVCRMKGSGHG